MVYESGFTTRRSFSSRPIVTSYAVSRPTKTPIDWERCPFVPRPSLIADPITAFGRRHSKRGELKSSILDPINKAEIKPSYKVLNKPIKPYIAIRDKNRERILSMVRQHIENIEVGYNAAGRALRDPTPRLDLCSSAPGTHRTRGSNESSYLYKSTVDKTSYDSRNPCFRPERSTYESTYESSSRSGPDGSNYRTERSSTSGGGPNGYTYSSTTSGNLPGGTRYRHFSYRV